MFLLSQGHHVKALAPDSFVEEIRGEIEKMMGIYV
jgi:predicted DNA-binding transcriptional regulator YafY